mgnify:CR=1 FL=1
MYEDKTLVCKECGNEFVFTAGEQEFYAERGFQNEPQRCKACRDARKNAARGPRDRFDQSHSSFLLFSNISIFSGQYRYALF